MTWPNGSGGGSSREWREFDFCLQARFSTLFLSKRMVLVWLPEQFKLYHSGFCAPDFHPYHTVGQVDRDTVGVPGHKLFSLSLHIEVSLMRFLLDYWRVLGAFFSQVGCPKEMLRYKGKKGRSQCTLILSPMM